MGLAEFSKAAALPEVRLHQVRATAVSMSTLAAHPGQQASQMSVSHCAVCRTISSRCWDAGWRLRRLQPGKASARCCPSLMSAATSLQWPRISPPKAAVALRVGIPPEIPAPLLTRKS